MNSAANWRRCLIWFGGLLLNVYRILPTQLRRGLRGSPSKSIIDKIVESAFYTDRTQHLDSRLPFGIGLFGYFEAENGIGAGVRSAYRSVIATGIPVVAISISSSTSKNTRWTENKSQSNPYAINILHVNADQSNILPLTFGMDMFYRRYSIGYWVWELGIFPDHWLPATRMLNEIWTPSKFVSESIDLKTNIPVNIVPHAVSVPSGDRDGVRKKYGIPPDACVFLCVFDYNSSIWRKNPMAAVTAFRAAFPIDRSNPEVRLLIKCHSGRGNFGTERQTLDDLISSDARIILIDEVLQRSDISGLQVACDAFVSLHRSEGFGLNIAECMGAGKAVIATDYSGSTDFVSNDCAIPIGYRLVPVKENEYPFSRNCVWADPDIEEAVGAMRRVATDPTLRASIGGAATKKILNLYSEQVIAKMISSRLEQLAIDMGKRY